MWRGHAPRPAVAGALRGCGGGRRGGQACGPARAAPRNAIWPATRRGRGRSRPGPRASGQTRRGRLRSRGTSGAAAHAGWGRCVRRPSPPAATWPACGRGARSRPATPGRRWTRAPGAARSRAARPDSRIPTVCVRLPPVLPHYGNAYSRGACWVNGRLAGGPCGIDRSRRLQPAPMHVRRRLKPGRLSQVSPHL